jgi:hypothetical protein
VYVAVPADRDNEPVRSFFTFREPYNESVFQQCDQEAQKRAEIRLRKHAAQLGFQVVPTTNT